MSIEVRVKRLNPRAIIPTYARPGDAGIDLHACITEDIWLQPGSSVLIGSGVAFEIPEGYEGQVRGRSSYAKLGVIAHVGTIDSGYRGEVKVCLHNLGKTAVVIRPGNRVGQLVIAPVARAEIVEVDALSESERGEGGFGSTGR